MDTIVFDFKCPQCFASAFIQLVTLDSDIKLVIYGQCDKCQIHITRKYDILEMTVPA